MESIIISIIKIIYIVSIYKSSTVYNMYYLCKYTLCWIYKKIRNSNKNKIIPCNEKYMGILICSSKNSKRCRRIIKRYY